LRDDRQGHRCDTRACRPNRSRFSQQDPPREPTAEKRPLRSASGIYCPCRQIKHLFSLYFQSFTVLFRASYFPSLELISTCFS
jgi:hypothetical protein